MSTKGLKILAITSGKGGVGKTTFTANLALRLADLGKNVLVLDGDLGLGNVCISLGLDPELGLEDFFYEGRRLNDICVVGPGGMKIIPGTSSSPRMARVDATRLDKFVRELQFFAGSEDYVLIDTGAGVGRHVLTFLMIAHEVLVLTTPEPTSMADAYGVIKSFYELGTPAKMSLVVNRCRSVLEAKGVENKIKLATRKFLQRELRMFGYVYQSPEIQQLSKEQKLLLLEAPGSRAAEQIKSMAAKVAGVADGRSSGNMVEKIMDFIQ